MAFCIVIDKGNTRVKVGVFKNSRLVKVLAVNRFGIREVSALLADYSPESVILSAVTKVPQGWLKMLRSRTNLVILGPETPLPIKNAYRSPETLGSDRLAGAVAAHVLFPGKPVLVIDAGTCIKYDFIDGRGVYKGGSIAPGIRMRLRAMHEFTGKLPLLEPGRTRLLTGNDTASSMLSGAVLGALYEATGFIASYRKRYPRIKIVLTGGDASFLSDHFKIGIFAAPDLVLKGLYAILLHATTSD